MRAAYYEQNGSAREVLRVAEVETPQAGPGEVRVKLSHSGVNPSDVKWRQGGTRKIAWPRLITRGDNACEPPITNRTVPRARYCAWLRSRRRRPAPARCGSNSATPASTRPTSNRARVRPARLRGRA